MGAKRNALAQFVIAMGFIDLEAARSQPAAVRPPAAFDPADLPRPLVVPPRSEAPTGTGPQPPAPALTVVRADPAAKKRRKEQRKARKKARR